MTTTTQYTDPTDTSPFGVSEGSTFGELFHQLISQASESNDPEVDAQMAWDCLAFAAASFLRNSDGPETYDLMRLLFTLSAQGLFDRMAEIASGSDDSEYDGSDNGDDRYDY